jgi:hypothetical protein
MSSIPCLLISSPLKLPYPCSPFKSHPYGSHTRKCCHLSTIMSLSIKPVSYHADHALFWNPPTPIWPPPKPSLYQQLSNDLVERINTRYDHPDYIHPVPNLELHSAAASGNVGLVHYALTHGQPVNSVLHGVLPLHAACSGGSVEVVRMLIERGANVNAPRLPRRYSDGRKSNAPSVGTAGMS